MLLCYYYCIVMDLIGRIIKLLLYFAVEIRQYSTTVHGFLRVATVGVPCGKIITLAPFRFMAASYTTRMFITLHQNGIFRISRPRADIRITRKPFQPPAFLVVIPQGGTNCFHQTQPAWRGGPGLAGPQTVIHIIGTTPIWKRFPEIGHGIIFPNPNSGAHHPERGLVGDGHVRITTLDE